MTILNALDPTPEQIKAFLDTKTADEPVFMLNLLKFKDKATYEDGEAVSGVTAYRRYAQAFGEMVRDSGADVETVYSGGVNGFLIGEGEGAWDAVAIIKYPNAALMFEMVSSEAYRKIHYHRRAGLAGQLLISCNDGGVF